MTRTPFARAAAILLGLLAASAGILATADLGAAALEKPAYGAGDRWTYVLQGSLGNLPGLNATQGGVTQLGLHGIVEVDVVGVSAAGVQVGTHASGFLNGSFGIPGNATIQASGTFSSDASETWENQDYLPVVSSTATHYMIDVTVVITTRVTADLWVNATTAYGSLPSFDLNPGDSVSAPFTSEIDVATSVSFFGFGQHMENHTSVAGAWNRHVLGLENVTVEAGTFPAYRINESLGGFPGISTGVAASGTNETAWFSNDVGSYVKRVAYVNGTPVAEMRLKSYTYPAPPTGLTLTDIALLVAVPIAVLVLVTFLILRRRKARPEKAKASSGAGPVGELPPKPPGAKP